jgi:protein-S-isoprenylcysteine O-methyltransferase Ste14
MLYWIGIFFTLLVGVLTFRIIVRRDYLQRGSLSFLATTLEFVIFALHANLPYLYLGVPWPLFPPLPESFLQRNLSLVIIAAGLVATLGIMAYLGFKTSIGEQPGTIRQTGPYRWSRNPQLLSYALMLLGFVGLFPSINSLAWFLLYAAIAHLMVLTEEEHLGNQFEGLYKEYCNQVPRYIFRLQSILPEKSKE